MHQIISHHDINLSDSPQNGRQSGKGCAIALGAFDGLHRGHMAVLDAARAAGRPLGLVVFEPPPRQFFNPGGEGFRLQLPKDRLRVAQDLGVDHIFELPFDRKMAQTSAEDFITNILVNGLGVTHVAVGHDFHFGAGRAGDGPLLQKMGAVHGFGVTIVPPVSDGERISSTRIRAALRGGDIAAANRLLGRPWSIIAEVEHGEKRGREIGWPTANMRLGQQIAPLYGIYTVTAQLPDGQIFGGVANFGRTPTTGLRDPLLEVHLFDFDGDLYGQELLVRFLDFQRPELKFDGLDQLIAAISADATQARAFLLQYGSLA